jgi:hypothetical protein
MSPDVPALLLAGIRDFQRSRPRSLQREVGPSQLGSPCDHCLAAALAGWEKGNDDAWLPLIGTAVHALLLGDGFLQASAYEGADWLTEQRVRVGQLGEGREARYIEGNADLFHIPTGTVVDFKIVGASTLNESRRNGSKLQYQRQIQLYGAGFVNAGYEVNTCTIAYLPRNSPNLSDAFFDAHPFDPTIAAETLAHAGRLAANAATFARVSERARDVFIDSLPRSPGCFDCARYPSLGINTQPSELAMFATTQGDHDNER